MDLLRLTTAGSVDDGKSTLIGRLMVDTKSILDDQYEAISRASGPGAEHLNLALVTDGLRAEREQGITIDVAYRYFATPKRKFIIADTPGHEQYTRNMVTGASTAQLAVVLIDARAGVARQSRRHGFITSLLRIPHMLVAVNKMDLVDYSEDVYNGIVADYSQFAQQLEVPDIVFIPIAALGGDNVVEKSANMPWYNGPTLLHHLENVRVTAEANVVDFRLPIQGVVRPHQGFRGFSGQITSGSIRKGEPVMVLPSARTSRVRGLTVFEGEIDEAGPGTPIVLSLEDEIDVSRGDMIVRRGNRPTIGNRLDVDLCWMSEEGMVPGRSYLLQHTTRRVKAEIHRVAYRLNIDTLHREEGRPFELNDIGRAEILTAAPLFFDAYRVNKGTGCFILIDPDTHATVAAGMIRGAVVDVPVEGVAVPPAADTAGTIVEGSALDRETRERRNGHQAAVIWLTGLSGSGKSTIARELERRLFSMHAQTAHLDGDELRRGLCHDLGFSADDRAENIRRVGEAARLFFERGCITICTFVSPYQADRERARALIPEGRFFEVHVDCALDTCADRDPKGLYRRARAGEIEGFTGVSAPYEPPPSPELVLRTDRDSVDSSVESLLAMLERVGILRPRQGA